MATIYPTCARLIGLAEPIHDQAFELPLGEVASPCVVVAWVQSAASSDGAPMIPQGRSW